MQRSIAWWNSLSDEQRAAVLDLPSGPLPAWVLDTMEAAQIPLATATIGSDTVRLAPTVTSDFLATRTTAAPVDAPG